MKNTLKNTLVITTIMSSLAINSQALAKTEGHYFGIDILRASAKSKTTKDSRTNADTYFNTNSKDSSVGFGAHYKYAINMNSFFIAPGLFYERIGTDAKVDNAAMEWRQNVKIKDRYGVTVDFGYDITKNFAAYIPLGYSFSNYELKTQDYISNVASLTTTTSGRKGSALYGFGLAFYPTETISINVEYNRSKLDLSSGGNVALVGNTNIKAKTTLDVIKLGVSYHF